MNRKLDNYDLIYQSNTPFDYLAKPNADVTIRQGRIIIEFGTRIMWLSLTPAEAKAFAELIISKAKAVEGI